MKPGAAAFVAISGGLFGFGLALSTMVKPEVVIDFLMWRDLGLLLVLGGAVAVTFLAYQLLPRLARKPWLADSFGKHPSELSARTLGGAAIFGIGWGLCGVCPGPAIAGLGVGNWPLLYALAGLAAGALVQGLFFAPRTP
jgi:uncharacterized membrane protein YedE/YeeE